MKTRIYIIGNVPSKINKECEERFYSAQLQLLQMGFDVINPIIRLTSGEFSFEEAKRKNIHDLMLSSAVYIMPCVELIKDVENIEIKLANDFNLLIISGILDLSPDKIKYTKSKKILNKT